MSGLRLLVRFAIALAGSPVRCDLVAAPAPAPASDLGREMNPLPTGPELSLRLATRTGSPGLRPASSGPDTRERTRARAAA